MILVQNWPKTADVAPLSVDKETNVYSLNNQGLVF